jgi:hypothetical protein
MTESRERRLQGSEYPLLIVFLALFGYIVWLWLADDGLPVYGALSALFVLGIIVTLVRGRTSMFGPPNESGFRAKPKDEDLSA